MTTIWQITSGGVECKGLKEIINTGILYILIDNFVLFYFNNFTIIFIVIIE